MSLCSVPAVVGELAAVRGALSRFAQRIGLPDELTHDFLLASYEATANIVEHAYAPGDDGRFDLSARYDAGTERLTVTITDHGTWKPQRPDPDSPRGRGLRLMQSCSDHLEVASDETGTQIRLQWNCALVPLPGEEQRG